jgi:hypothetical protein
MKSGDLAFDILDDHLGNTTNELDDEQVCRRIEQTHELVSVFSAVGDGHFLLSNSRPFEHESRSPPCSLKE